MSRYLSIDATGLVIREPGGQPRTESMLVGAPAPGEVRVSVLASGICHTDLLVVRGRSWWPDYPYVLGHEGVGRIDAVGDGADRGRVGQYVLLAWKSPCARCRSCVRGRPWVCLDPPTVHGRLRTTDDTVVTPSLRVGSHASSAVVPAAAAIPLPEAIGPEVACLIGCAGLTGFGAVHNTAGVQPGDRVLVSGCGAVGLSIITAARTAGAACVIALDPRAARRAVASSAGADQVLDPQLPDIAAVVRELCGAFGVDHAFDAVGRPESLETLMDCLDTGGTCTLVGTPDVGATTALDLERAYLRRISLRVSQYGDVLPARDAPAIANLHLRGTIDLGLLLSQELQPTTAVEGFRALERGESVRSVIRFGR